jgi:hypothetical protein
MGGVKSLRKCNPSEEDVGKMTVLYSVDSPGFLISGRSPNMVNANQP